MLLELEKVSFAYKGSRPVLAAASLGVQRGDFVMVAGPSGSGKSTFLRLLCRLEEPDSGEIRLGGKPIADIHPPRLRRSISYIRQVPALVEGSVRDNLLMPFGYKANKDLAKPDDSRITTMMNRFLLDGVSLEQEAQTLSVGQAQRLCLIRALLLDPEILLLDEPTSALDRESGQKVVACVEELNLRRGLTIIMVAHGGPLPEPGMVRNLVLKEGTLQWSRQTPS